VKSEEEFREPAIADGGVTHTLTTATQGHTSGAMYFAFALYDSGGGDQQYLYDIAATWPRGPATLTLCTDQVRFFCSERLTPADREKNKYCGIYV